MDEYKNDIDKYLKGQLTPAQMHALEKKALSDPFLADALEGLGSVPSDELREDLLHLQATLNKRTQKTGNVWMLVARIAAGLFLLVAATFVIVFISDQSVDRTSNLALNKEEKLAPEAESQDAPSASADSLLNDDAASSRVAEEPQKAKEKAVTPEPKESRSRQDQLAQIPAEDAKTSTKEDPTPENLSDATGILESAKDEEKTATAIPSDSGPPVVRLETDNAKNSKADDAEAELSRKKGVSGAAAREHPQAYKAPRKIIQGKVTFAGEGTGLPGVNVLLKGTNEGAVTDGKGFYQIPVAAEEPTLIFSFIGFASKEVEATGDALDVELDADVSELSEVVVVGYGSSTDVGFLPSTPTVMELATPEGGRKVFKQYLENNLKYPEQALKNGVEGKVTVQFTIGLTGQLSDFTVVRGLGYGCDEEVIRLIKDGPKWSPTKKNEAPIRDRVRVRMRFALPKK